MNTILNRNKSLFLAIFLSLTLPLGGSSAKAQTVEPVTQAQIQELQNTLVALLTQLIAQLQAQITELLAQQAIQTTQLGAVESKISTIQTQTMPVVIQAPQPTITLGNPVCNQKRSMVEIPVSGSGWAETIFTYPSYLSQNNKPVFTSPTTGRAIVRTGDPYLRFQTNEGWPTTYELSGIMYESEVARGQLGTFSQTIELPVCN